MTPPAADPRKDKRKSPRLAGEAPENAGLGSSPATDTSLQSPNSNSPTNNASNTASPSGETVTDPPRNNTSGTEVNEADGNEDTQEAKEDEYHDSISEATEQVTGQDKGFSLGATQSQVQGAAQGGVSQSTQQQPLNTEVLRDANAMDGTHSGNPNVLPPERRYRHWYDPYFAPPPPYSKKTKIKIDRLETLGLEDVQTFLHQVTCARQIGEPVCVAGFVAKKALTKLRAKCGDTTDDEKVLRALREVVREERKAFIHKPVVVVKETLKWSTDKELTNTQRNNQFFDDLLLLTREAELAGKFDNHLIKERVLIEAVNKLPVDLGVRAEDVRDDTNLHDIEELRKFVENRLGLLTRPNNPRAYRKLNNVDANEQDGYNGYEPEQGEDEDVNLYGISRVGQGPYRPQQPYQPRQYRPVYCYNCSQHGHTLQECTLPTQPGLLENLKAHIQRNGRLPTGPPAPQPPPAPPQPIQQAQPQTQKPRQQNQQPNRRPGLYLPIWRVGTSEQRPATIELFSGTGWTQVNGCLDSGADGNVAPVSFAKYSTGTWKMDPPMTYELPDGTQYKAHLRGRLTARVLTDNGAFDLGMVPFHFIEDPKWTQLLFGRPTLARHKITPEQAIQHIQKAQQQVEGAGRQRLTPIQITPTPQQPELGLAKATRTTHPVVAATDKTQLSSSEGIVASMPLMTISPQPKPTEQPSNPSAMARPQHKPRRRQKKKKKKSKPRVQSTPRGTHTLPRIVPELTDQPLSGFSLLDTITSRIDYPSSAHSASNSRSFFAGGKP